MTQPDPLEAALALATPEAQVVGLWLALHKGIPSLGPRIGVQLSDINLPTREQVKEEQDPVAKAAVQKFLRALQFVIEVELVHEGAVIRGLQEMLKAIDAGSKGGDEQT